VTTPQLEANRQNSTFCAGSTLETSCAPAPDVGDYSRVTAQALLIAATPSNEAVEMTAHRFDNYALIQSQTTPPDDVATAIQRSVPVLVEMVENNDNLNGIADGVTYVPGLICNRSPSQSLA
jgi:hypothetical protein